VNLSFFFNVFIYVYLKDIYYTIYYTMSILIYLDNGLL